jgi:hypothetical protein
VLTLAVSLGPTSCAKKQQAAGPQNVLSELVIDDTGRAQLDVGYISNPPDMIRLLVELSGVGIDEMDKLAVDVSLDGFDVVEGSSQWAGFVPPRESRKHEMLLRAREDVDEGTVTVTLSRFHDSSLLWEDTARFSFTGTSIVAQ